MRQRSAIVLVAVLSSCNHVEHQHCTTCGSDGGSGTDGGVCNVLTQNGCDVGEKCTWIIDMADMTSSIGHIGCAPAGTMATGSACTRNAPGALGYDDCAAGAYCFGPDTGGAGVCKAICDQSGGDPMCSATTACSTYDGLFGPSGMAVAAGVCDPKCDPLADNNFLGSAGDNRSGTSCGSQGSAVGSGYLYTYGCYGFPYPAEGATKFTCSRQYNYSRFHRTSCDTTQHAGDLGTCAPDSTHVYLNGCASGYMPLFTDDEGSSVTDCMAMCAPVSCYNAGTGSTPGAATCGSAAGSNITGLAPHQCNTTDLQFSTFSQIDPASSWSSANPTVNNGEQCYFSWLFEIDSNTNMLAPSATSDTVGFCVDHSKYKYDPSGGSAAMTTWPRCDGIGMGSNGYNAAFFDAAAFGCVDTATARTFGDVMFDGKTTIRRPPLRMPYHASRAGRR